MNNGWQEVKIEDVAQVINGGTPKTKVGGYWGGKHLWITPAEMGGLNTPYLAQSRRKLTDSGLSHSSASLIPKCSVILSTRAPIGHLVINEVPMAFNQGCRGLVPGNRIDYKFLYYFLRANVALLNDLGTGTTFRELAAGKLKRVPIPLPPPPEQKRIVAILDQAFAGMDKAIANTEKNLANTRELFESHLNSVFNQPDGHWTDKELAAFSKTVSTGPFGSILHKSDYVSDGVPLVNPINIQGERIIPDAKKMVSLKTAGRLRAYILNRGDIVIARRGEIGRCAVVSEEQDGWICGTGCFFIRPGAEVIPEFLAHLLRSAKYRKKLERVATGATMPNLSNKALSTFHVSLPDVETQTAFVKDIADFGAHCSNLRSTHKKQLTAQAELKQSLLQKAFEGELTADAERDVEDALA